MFTVYVVRVKITKNYQITTPAEIRSKMGLKEGEEVEIYLDESGRILIERVGAKRKTFVYRKKLLPGEIDRIIEKGILEVSNESRYRYQRLNLRYL